jgi:hypothetical protein
MFVVLPFSTYQIRDSPSSTTYAQYMSRLHDFESSILDITIFRADDLYALFVTFSLFCNLIRASSLPFVFPVLFCFHSLPLVLLSLAPAWWSDKARSVDDVKKQIDNFYTLDADFTVGNADGIQLESKEAKDSSSTVVTVFDSSPPVDTVCSFCFSRLCLLAG